METLNIIKIGGNIIDDEVLLNDFITSISTLNDPFILVHGGGKLATDLAEKLNIPQQLIDGRRVTNAETLKIATMVYAGFINKTIVALLQKNSINSIGLSGADGNLIHAKKRKNNEIDYGFVGDFSVENVNTSFLELLLNNGLTPVICAITHDKNGQLLNTNADSIASNIASNLATSFEIKLVYCFEKKGVLSNPEDDDSVIESLDFDTFQDLKNKGIINKGMLPKIENGFQSLENGVKEIGVINAKNCVNFISKNNNEGTRIT
ncbi:acetylglutamate kinase [Flavobacterium arsenatis]|uniref:Acetylglutamate kinase n=1 Tax=Flavobacterium arsenatis TaxID=1484332 RepID=A0ABU1TRZ8_9FLAO|nr:acetylglutamate kinase [Flavobacterium arsenatis]MDR6968631.1 acetylglutamate kinase [Flavobacterium arsenatis]